MAYIILCGLVFLGTFSLSMIYTSIFYHRGFAHNAVNLPLSVRQIIAATGSWITGIDMKTWVCMHRLHHRYSDTERDPHSPVFWGIPGTLWAQYHSYGIIKNELINNSSEYQNVVRDIEFPVSWLDRKGLWILPYVVHGLITVSLGLFFHVWILGIVYWVGLMSHPIAGWMVNSFGHKIGYRNFSTQDNSRNNIFVGYLVFGEGYQNNHHYAPSDANFSYRWWEIDVGYWLCLLMSQMGLVTINPGLKKSHRKPSSWNSVGQISVPSESEHSVIQ